MQYTAGKFSYRFIWTKTKQKTNKKQKQTNKQTKNKQKQDKINPSIPQITNKKNRKTVRQQSYFLPSYYNIL